MLNLILFFLSLFGVSNIKKITFKSKVDKSDPVKTPILTPSILGIFSTKVKISYKKTYCKSNPSKLQLHKIYTQFELFGIWAIFVFIDIYEKTKTPNCLPTNNLIIFQVELYLKENLVIGLLKIHLH